MKATRSAPFFAAVWTGASPLLVWGLHFAFNYIAVAVACAGTPTDPAALRAWLQATTVLAVVVLAVMLWRSCASVVPSGHAELVRRVCVLLSLIGVAWTGVPTVLLPACAP